MMPRTLLALAVSACLAGCMVGPDYVRPAAPVPEAYKEMNLSTSGQFGGLGIVISIRDQQLTVINPMPNTPAGRAGVKRLDRIVNVSDIQLRQPRVEGDVVLLTASCTATTFRFLDEQERKARAEAQKAKGGA